MLIRVDSTPDTNCYVCEVIVRRLCDSIMPEDNQLLSSLMPYARRRGYEVAFAQEPHPLDPNQFNYISSIPAVAIQDYVYDTNE